MRQFYLAPDQRIGVFGWSPHQGGVHHHRIAEPLRVLGELGVHAFTGRVIDDDVLAQVDTVLVHTLHTVTESPAWERLARIQTHRLVLDVDDWMWGPDWRPFKNAYTPDTLARLFRNVELAHVVTTPSPQIAEFLARYNRNVWVVPNTVPAWLLDHDMPARPHPTVGYQGSASHVGDWTSPVRKGFYRWLLDHPEWHVAGYGQLDASDAPDMAHRVTITPWQGIEDYYRTVSMDVGIGPLRDTPFNRAKSALRAVEYAALGVVPVLPDLPPYRGWVHDGINGRLVHTHQTLPRVLDEVARDEPWRREAAIQGRIMAKEWTTEAAIGAWLEAWLTQ